MNNQMSNRNGDRAQINARLNELSSRKRRIEEEIRQMNEILQANGNVGMDSSLVDSEGFPRSDIDVAAVRTARNRIIHLNNDHRSVMLALEESLNQMHQLMRTPNGVTSPVTSGDGLPSQDVVVNASLEPFLLVDEVKSESPAEHAGLKVGDRIVRFDSVTASNFRGLQDIASVNQNAAPLSAIRVDLLRPSMANQIFHLRILKPADGTSLGMHVSILR